MNAVVEHYAIGDLANKIAAALQAAGKDLDKLAAEDLASIDEFHIRGRVATLELGTRMGLGAQSHMLDIGGGLGDRRAHWRRFMDAKSPASISTEFCDTANALSGWVGLADRVVFRQGDATALDVVEGGFDAAMTLHASMNIAAKDAMYAGVHKALKPSGTFAVYDILQGEGGEVLFPVPWARRAEISHLVTAREMRDLLEGAGFQIVHEEDSTEAGEAWFERVAAKLANSVSLRQFLGADAAQMTQNQVRNLSERRIRTVTFICRRRAA
jgi:ubiquinone/menaquinone biosynthesis C-methylase UbiE